MPDRRTIQLERAPKAPPRSWTIRAAPLSGADRLARSRLWRGRRRVLEFLLGAEHRVEDLLAQSLAQREGQPRADETDQEEAAATPLLPLTAQRFCRLAQRRGCLAELLLDLLVFGNCPDGALAVRHPRVRLARGIERRAQVVTQVLVLDHPLDVGVRPNRLTRGDRSGSGLRGLFLTCHRSPRIGLRVCTL